MLLLAVARQSTLATQIQAVTVASKTSSINSRVLLILHEAYHGVCHVFTDEIVRLSIIVPVVYLL